MTTQKYLNKTIKVKIDRPLGSLHPKHKFKYSADYGYVPNTKIHRLNDNDDKLVIAPKGVNLADEEIRKRLLTPFTEPLLA